jgi:photosystem II stability/assembly factor-like uncharacterized protein
MNKIDTQLSHSDPVDIVQLEAACSHAVFEELFGEVVADQWSRAENRVALLDDWGELPFGSEAIGAHAHRERRRHVILVTAVAAVAVLVIAAIASPTAGPTSRVAMPSTRPVLPPRWHLVGDFSQPWHTLGGVDYEPGLFLDCPAEDTCYAANVQEDVPLGTYRDIEVTGDGGATWRESTLPVAMSGSTLTEGASFVCVDASTCALLGVDSSGQPTFMETTDGGQSWKTEGGPSGLHSSSGVVEISCSSASTCTAIGSDPDSDDVQAVAFTTADGGSSWASSALPVDFVPGRLQCASAQDCITTGFYQSPDGNAGIPPAAILYTGDGGSSWDATALPSGLGPLSSLSCADATECVAGFFGDNGSATALFTTDDGGATWTRSDAGGLPSGLVSGLSCPQVTSCWAAGISQARGATRGSSGSITVTMGGSSGGFVASTDDDARTWQAAQLPTGVFAVLRISCPAATTCYALAAQHPSSGSGASLVLLTSATPTT